MTIGEKIKKQLDAMHKNIVWLSDVTGIPKTTIYSMVKKESDNTLDNIVLIAKALDLSIDYLLDMHRDSSTALPSSSTLNEKKIIELLKQLNEEGQEKLLEQAEFFISSERYKKRPNTDVDAI